MEKNFTRQLKNDDSASGNSLCEWKCERSLCHVYFCSVIIVLSL
uniref:Uncharacterized protein n=1 Tax=Anguilla anguilla TaxID=7936 RepID=A0A0E9PMY7_ANGAN